MSATAIKYRVALRARNKWVLGIFKAAAEYRKKQLLEIKTNEEADKKKRLYLQYRIGYNLYWSGAYFEAIEVLSRCCTNGIELTKEQEKALAKKRNAAYTNKDVSEMEGEDELLNKNFRVHMWTGRCCVKLFQLSKAHYHLENAYKHFQDAIEAMTVPNDYDQTTTLMLPQILMDLGRVLERYGAFQPALEIYSQAMRDFPNSRIYFDIMYRSTIVGKHVAEIMTNPTQRDEVLNKCIDMLQFLLEALPSTINDAHIILLYARTLEKSTDPAIRYRASGVYQSLFDFCRETKQAHAEEYATYREWADEPSSWLKLGEELSFLDEPLLAKDGYENFVARIDLQRGPGKDLSSVMNIPTCMQIAKHYAGFQNYNEAVKFAELALKQDRLNKEVRFCLSKWSKIHAIKLNKEEVAINTLHVRWKERCWSDNYRRKLKKMVVTEFEEKLERNRYDKEARNALAYYAKEKWRAKFLFEASCAIRIQRFMRERFICWKVQAKSRMVYLSRASSVYPLFQRKPYDAAVRAEIFAITNSRFCPRKHIIKRVRLVLDDQNDAVLVMQRCVRAYSSRRAIMRSILNTKRKMDLRLFVNARTIQCLVRKRIARRAIVLRKLWWKKRVNAAILVQNFVRWRNKQFQHAVTRIIARRKMIKARARDTLKYVFGYQAARHLDRKHRAERIARENKIRAERKARREHNAEIVKHAVHTVQRFFRASLNRMMTKIALCRTRARRRSHLSGPSAALLQICVDNMEGVRYHAPGIRASSLQFQRALLQTIVYISGEFSAADCMMLSTVLRHPLCKIQKLIFHRVIDAVNNGSFEFDILPAVCKCNSLRAVLILDTHFSDSFLFNLIREVQVENPRIVDVFIENVANKYACRDYPARLSERCGQLLLDYFNYSVPGLVLLSLHGCALRDSDVSIIAQGVAVNSSLRELILSLNLITDEGLVELLQAVSHNKKGVLSTLDLSDNVIACKRRVRVFMDKYKSPRVGETPPGIEIWLHGNMLNRPYPEVEKSILNPRTDLVVKNIPRDQKEPDPQTYEGRKELLKRYKELKAAVLLRTSSAGGSSPSKLVAAAAPTPRRKIELLNSLACTNDSASTTLPGRKKTK